MAADPRQYETKTTSVTDLGHFHMPYMQALACAASESTGCSCWSIKHRFNTKSSSSVDVQRSDTLKW